MFGFIKSLLVLIILLWVIHILLLVANLADNPVIKAVGRILKRGFKAAIWLLGILLELLGVGLTWMGSAIRSFLK